MTFFASIERQADRIAPALIVFLGFFVAMNTAGLVI
jgi:preprotein translocase subunit Sec61beta